MVSPAFDGVRVTGTLLADAQLQLSTGAEPHAFLQLQCQPPQGLPYWAQVDLGADPSDHMAAEGLLVALRRGAIVSVGGLGLLPRTDHGHAVLRLLGGRNVLLLQAAPAPTAATTTTSTPTTLEATHAA